MRDGDKGGKDKASTRSKFGRTYSVKRAYVRLSFSFPFPLPLTHECTTNDVVQPHATDAVQSLFPSSEYVHMYVYVRMAHARTRILQCIASCTRVFPLAGFLCEIKHKQKIKYSQAGRQASKACRQAEARVWTRSSLSNGP